MRILLIILILLMPLPGQGATRQEPAYREMTFAANYPWSEGFTINFPANEAECRKKYGSRWAQKCAASLGQPGQTASGVRLTPKAAGVWQWSGPNTLTFLPDNGGAIRPGTNYTADVSGLRLPGYISLNRKLARGRALPLSAQIEDSRFWADPSPRGEHRLAMSFQFNYPVPRDNFEIALALPQGAQAGKVEMVWNPDRDHLAVSWPIRKLAQNGGMAEARLKGMGQIWRADDGFKFADTRAAGAAFGQEIPGLNQIFKINGAKIARGRTDGLDQRHELEIETSLYTTAERLLDNLMVVELPEYKSGEALLPYDWTRARRVSAEELKKGRALKPENIQAEDAPRARFRFSLPVKDGRHVFVGISDKLRSANDLPLARAWAGVMEAAPFGGQTGFLQPGNILPGKTKVDVFGVDLDAINWEAWLVEDAFLALLAQTSPEPYKSPLQNIDLGMESLASLKKGSLPLPAREAGKAQYASIDTGEIFADGKANGLALLKLAGMKDGREVASAQKLILATDLALLAKRSRTGALECFAHYLGTGKPAAGAKIAVLGANGNPAAESVADSEGHARFESLAGLGRESRPVAVAARIDGQLAWLPLQDRGRELNYSEFAAGGKRVGPDDILAYVFSQRGVYRPGDPLYFGCVLRRADFSLVPADLPLFAELLNPAGRKIREKTFKPGPEGIAELAWETLPESLSGNYVLNIRTGREGEIIGSASARIEAFMPDTLKLKIAPPEVRGWYVSGRDAPQASLFLQNLYGSPAKNHRVRAEVSSAPAVFRFAGYENYTFSDPAPFLGSGASRQLPELRTDAEGRAKLDIPADLLGASARIAIAAEGFDSGGGRATSGAASFLCSPMDRALGYRPLGQLTNMDFINRGEKAELEFLALDSSLEPVAWKGVNFSVLRRAYVSSLVSDGAGGFRYDDEPQELLLKTWRQDLPKGPVALGLDTSEPGEFLLVAKDGEGRTLARIPYNIAGERLAGPEDRLAASKMRMRLDRADYRGGDEITIAWSLPYEAIGLATIERDRVEAFKWIEAAPGDNIAKIRIPENFDGKGFVTLTFMRKTSSPAIYMTPLAFALAPFNAGMQRRDMGVEIDAPEVAAPGGDLVVKVSAAKPGRAFVYAVDEGILQLAPWSDPAPLAGLLGERALDVATLQTADLLMPEHAALRLSAFGGGAEISPFGARFQNPFRRRGEPPLTFWSGLLEIGATPLEIRIPVAAWHSGKIRIFAVGAGEDSAGAAIAGACIRGPLVLTPQAPAAVAPGDEFTGTLTLANTTAKAATVKLAATPSAGLEFTEKPPASVEIPAGSEVVVSFGVRALDRPGEARIDFAASTPEGELRRQIALSLRPAGALRSTFAAGIATGPTDLAPGRDVYEQFARSEASASGLPLPLGQSFGRYLDAYPYGCTEQLASRAFAWIMLSRWPGFMEDAEKREKLLAAAKATLANRYNGRFVGLWNGDEGNLLLTAYVADYLLSLRESGFGQADGLLAGICDSLSWNLALNQPSLAAARASAYAIWVLAREGRVVTQQLETLLRSLDEREVAGWEEDLTAILIAAIKRELAIPVKPDPASLKFEPSGWFDEYAQRALAAAILARYFPEEITPEFRQDFYDASLAALNSGSFCTFSAAQGIRALVGLGDAAAPELKNASLKCVDPGADGEFQEDGAILRARANICRQYRLEYEGDQPVFWQTAATGYDRKPLLEAKAEGIEISREYLDRDGASVSEARQGDELLARITVRSRKGALADCAISDLLPGCLEMILPRQPGPLPKGVKAIDRQEDRLLVFADLDGDQTRIEYRCRVVSPGKFRIPAITAEAMYDQSVYGNGASGEMTVSAER